MAVSFVAAGALAANATTVTLNIVAPTLAVDDIMIAVILGKDNQVITPPDANWTKIVESDNTTAQRITIAWKRAVAGDSGATFAFTKPTDNNILFCGVISAWRGCVATGSPIDATAPSIDPAATAVDIVDYATFDPTETDAFVVAAAVYNNDLTAPGNVSGTNPTFSLNVDLETGTGTDGSIFVSSGSSNGAATGTRTQASNASADAINIGVLFGLIALAAQSFTVDIVERVSVSPSAPKDQWNAIRQILESPRGRDAVTLLQEVVREISERAVARDTLELLQQVIRDLESRVVARDAITTALTTPESAADIVERAVVRDAITLLQEVQRDIVERSVARDTVEALLTVVQLFEERMVAKDTVDVLLTIVQDLREAVIVKDAITTLLQLAPQDLSSDFAERVRALDAITAVLELVAATVTDRAVVRDSIDVVKALDQIAFLQSEIDRLEAKIDELEASLETPIGDYCDVRNRLLNP